MARSVKSKTVSKRACEELTFDPFVPEELKVRQLWFGGIIGQPIDDNSCIHPVAPSGLPIEEEAKKYIAPSQTLLPHERIQIYNQQYWWRLLSTLHDTFPFLTSLFGYRDFNNIIATPYLLKNPPNHYSLNNLGNRLTDWIKENYHENDQEIVHLASDIDWAHQTAFLVRELPTLKTSGEHLLTTPLKLQPHLHLYHLPYDIFSFRKEIVNEDADYWLTCDFPKLTQDREYFFVLFRDRSNNICVEEIAFEEYTLLERIEKGTTLEELCHKIEDETDHFQKAVEENLSEWTRKWAYYPWIGEQ